LKSSFILAALLSAHAGHTALHEYSALLTVKGKPADQARAVTIIASGHFRGSLTWQQ